MGKRHHIVPQFYLRCFASQHDSERIWMYTKNAAYPTLIRIENVAFENDYYSIENEDGTKDSDSMEAKLSQLESEVAPLFAMISKGLLLSEEEHQQLIYFVATMAIRGPAGKMLMETAVHRTGKRYIDKYSNLTPRMNEFIHSLIDKELTQESYVNNIFERGEVISSYFLQQSINIYKANDDFKFATTDNPFSRYFEVDGEIKFASQPSPDRFAEWILPISTDLCLIIEETGKKEFDYSHKNARNSLIRRINYISIGGAKRFAYYHKNCPRFQSIVQQYIGSLRGLMGIERS